MIYQPIQNTNAVYTSRIKKLSNSMTAAGLRAIFLNPGASLVYLTGLHFHLSERPVIAVFIPHESVSIILPELEAGKAENLSFSVRTYPYTEDPSTWAGEIKKGIKEAISRNGPVGIEPRQLRYLEFSLLNEAAPGLTYSSAESVLANLRMYKDVEEIESMQRAVHIAQEALRSLIPLISTGKSEREIASNLILELIKAGSEVEFPFSPIVSGGPNSANPHATPGSRELVSGDLLVIDWGASFNGYLSDITRTFAIGEIDEEFEKIATIVNEANREARAIVRPGISAEEVDVAARTVIETAGFGKYFIHRTGHGLGLESHEEPYIRSGNNLILREGMTFTIEPGIYLPGKGGVRIEDNVYVTKDGYISLTDFQRELVRI